MKFDEIKVGDKAELKHTITQNDIEKFIQLTGDDNKLHYDAAYAQRTSLKKPVAHGMLGASFISTIIGTKIPGDGALWFAQSFEFLLPVRVGDEITVRAEVIKKTEQLQAIEMQTDIYNQYQQKVTTGIAKVKIMEQLEEEVPTASNEKERKTVLIIGATGGIGSAACLQLANDGFDIAIHYHSNKSKAESLQETISKLGVKTCIVSGGIDSKNDAEKIVNQVVRQLGDISVFINCATLKLPSVKFDLVEWHAFEDHFNINVRTNYLMAQELIPMMKNLKYGKFLFLSSQVTDSVPPANWSFYNTAKYALNGFAKSLAVELASHNIKVNLISPGMTDTELLADLPEKAKLLVAAKIPLKRLAKPEDVANIISFLASDKSNYLTGETIRVNGGQTMN